MSNKVCIIIPCFNEEAAIAKTINEVHLNMENATIVVVDDCSTDKTLLVAKSTNKATVISLPCNLGVGGAVQTGMIFARDHNFDFAVKLDGDGQHNPVEVSQMLQHLFHDQADIIIGSRFLSPDLEGYKSSFLRRFGIKFLEILCKLLTGLKITDPTSGYRAYNKRAISFMAENYPSFDYPEPEEIILANKNQLRIMETPASMRSRETGISSISSTISIYYMLKVSLSMLFIFLRKKQTTRTEGNK